MSKYPLFSQIGVAILVTGVASSAMAATSTWLAGGSGNNWNTAANWDAAVVPSTTTDLIFAGNVTKTVVNNDFAAGSNFRNITFNVGTLSGGFVLGGNDIVLNGNVTNAASSPLTQVINLNLNENGGVRTFQTGVSGILGAPYGNYNRGDLVVNGVISNGGLTKTGGGALYLNGDNTYTGVTTFSAGTLSVNKIGNGGVAGGLGAATSDAANLVFNGGALQYTGASASTDRNFTINTGITAIINVKNAGTNLTLAGTNNAGSTGALLKTGVGALTLTNTMTYTGATTVQAGKLTLDFSAAGAPASNLLASGGIVNIGSGSVASGSSSIIGSNGYGSFTETLGAWATSATLAIKGSGTAAVTQTFGNLNILMNAGVGIAAHLNLEGGTASAPVTVNFNQLNTFNGATQGVTLDISKGENDVVHFTTSTLYNGLLSGASTGNTVGVTLNGADWASLDANNNVVAATYTNNGSGNTANSNVTSSYTANGVLSLRFNAAASNTVTLASGNLGGVLVTSTVGANTTTIAGTAAAGVGVNGRQYTFIQNNTMGDLVVSASLTGGAGVAKSGSGRLILSGTNTYTGNTYVNEGILQISSNKNLGADNLSLNSISPQVGTLNLNGTLEVRGGANVVLDGYGTQSGIYRRNILIGSDAATIDVDAGTTLTVTGGINPNTNGVATTGALIKTNDGTLVLNGVNNNVGGLVVNGGTVQANFSTAGTTVAATKMGVRWSVNATASTGNPIQSFTSGATTITVYNGATGYADQLKVGAVIAGTGIAAGTYITAINGSTVTLSQQTTGASSGTYSVYQNGTTATFASGATTLAVGSTDNIQVGAIVTGTGIPTGAVVTAVDTVNKTVTLNVPTTAASVSNYQYAFGGANQWVTSSTAGLGGGAVVASNGFNGTINGIVGNVISNNNINNGSLAVQTSQVFGASDSLGAGDVTVNAGTLDLGGISHQPVQAVKLTGGTLQNGTIQGSSYTAAVGSGTTATVSANLAGSTSVGFTKTGAGKAVVSGANTYAGGTVVKDGVLLVNNATGSGVGTGAVTVETTGTLGGTGIIALTGTNGLDINGTIAPGDGIGTLTVDLGSSTGTVAVRSGAVFSLQLGAVGNATIDAIAADSSDLIRLSNAVAGDFAFNNNTVDFLGTGASGYYKLFDTSLNDASTWTGLTYDATTGVVSSGLTATNLAAGFSGDFVVGTAANGGEVGDIYFHAVPEPGSIAFFGIGGLAMFAMLRRRK